MARCFVQHHKAFLSLLLLLVVVLVSIVLVFSLKSKANPSDSADRPTLVVGVTLDYAPFSIPSEDGNMELAAGMDAELALAFGESVRMAIEFRQTSWPALAKDLQQGAFDLAWTGVTITADRISPDAQTFSRFSVSETQGGKQVVMRCASVVDTWEALDQPGHIIFTNPGGSNEQYVREHVEYATIQVEDDNMGIFAKLARGQGDAMLTDNFEAAYYTRSRDGALADDALVAAGVYSQKEPLCIALRGELLNTFSIAVWLHKQAEPILDPLNAFLRSDTAISILEAWGVPVMGEA